MGKCYLSTYSVICNILITVITYFSIPKGNLGKKWIKQIKQFQQNFKPTKYSIICSKHFIESSYYVDRINGNRTLKRTSIPSLFKMSK